MNTNTHIWCSNCAAIHPIVAGEMRGNDLSRRFTNPTDLCCGNCHLVVATTYALVVANEPVIPTADRVAQRELPKYRSHKIVAAIKIKAIEQAPAEQEKRNAGGDWYVIPEEDGYGPVMVGHDDYILRHKPHAGGYYVVYEDGYQSFSPAQAFENGYTRL